jgi:beta-glucosidase
MNNLGIKSYRFSIAWSRVLPEGTGRPNPKGLDFYNRLVDRLLEAGIEPVTLLNHWDFPQALMEKGGWPNRDSITWFTDYARLMFDQLGDRVKTWDTHNEPWVAAFLGYGYGYHAPGICDYSQAYQAAHHLLMAHGNVVQLFRQGGYQGQIGLVIDINHYLPASQSAEDVAAFQRVYQEVTNLFLDPIFTGRYPEQLFEWIGRHRPKIASGDLEAIHQPIDFLGINYYRAHTVAHQTYGSPLKTRLEPLSAPGWGRTDMGWGIYPAGLTYVLKDIQQRYRPAKIYVTENGCAMPDTINEKGAINDWGRIDYLRAHLHAIHTAIQAGVNVHGYYVWSIMDNFEWAEGYRRRFGLVHVDFKTQKRTPKASAHWYSKVVADNAITI